MDLQMTLGLIAAGLALVLAWRIARKPRPDLLPPPSKDTERGRDAGWWS